MRGPGLELRRSLNSIGRIERVEVALDALLDLLLALLFRRRFRLRRNSVQNEWSLNRRYMQLEGLQTVSDTVPTRLSAVTR